MIRAMIGLVLVVVGVALLLIPFLGFQYFFSEEFGSINPLGIVLFPVGVLLWVAGIWILYERFSIFRK